MSRIRFSYLNVFTGKLRLSSFSHSRHVNAHKGSGQISKTQLTQSNSLVVDCYIVVPFPTRDIIFGLSILIRSLNTRNSFVDNMNIEVSSFLAAAWQNQACFRCPHNNNFDRVTGRFPMCSVSPSERLPYKHDVSTIQASTVCSSGV